VIVSDTGLQDFTIRLVLERGRTIEFHGPADITRERTDAIVNAANSSLLGGGGVDGAIHRTGGAAIHTVGPVYRGGERGEPEQLASCHRECIRLADLHGLASLSFPAISTGAFGYPISEAAMIATSSTLKALATASQVRKVRFVLFDVATLKAYTRVAKDLRQSNNALTFRIEKAS
jgi:O-acetyl-ADP-ribose deacetylase (regulator of RNase III)